MAVLYSLRVIQYSNDMSTMVEGARAAEAEGEDADGYKNG